MSEETKHVASDYAARFRSPFFWCCLLVFGLGALAYFPAFFPPSIVAIDVQSEQFFFEPNEAAGLPVLILSAWLFYRRSHFLDVLRGPGAIGPGAGTLTIGAALYAWGAYTSSSDLQLASIIFVLLGGVLLLGGLAAVRAFWLPILFFGFALPVSPVLLAATLYPAQLLTAQFSGLILNGIGAASYVQGDQILRAEGSFIVIETCSGVRSIFTLSMLTILLIDLFERRGWHVLVLIVLAPVVAFFVNGIRVVTLVLNPHSSIHSVHNLQGIAMLLVGLVLIYLLDGQLERAFESREPDAAASDYGSIRVPDEAALNGVVAMGAVASVLVAMLAFALAGPKWEISRVLDEKPGELLTRVFGLDPRAPYPMDYHFVGSVHYLAHARHRVEVDGGIVEIHLGVANEQLRRSSILTKRLAWPETGYAPVEESFVDLASEGPLARRMILRRGAQSMLSYSWIERRGGFAKEWFRQTLALDRSPLVRPQRMLAIRLSTKTDVWAAPDEAAERRIRKVWARLAPELPGYAPTQPIRSEVQASLQ